MNNRWTDVKITYHHYKEEPESGKVRYYQGSAHTSPGGKVHGSPWSKADSMEVHDLMRNYAKIKLFRNG